MKYDYSYLLKNTEELRKLILENPELPLVVFAGQDANIGDYSMVACSRISAYIGEVLDCETEYSDEVHTDREYFAEVVSDYYYSSFDGTESEFDEYIDAKVAEYDQYWKKCIILEVDN